MLKDIYPSIKEISKKRKIIATKWKYHYKKRNSE